MSSSRRRSRSRERSNRSSTSSTSKLRMDSKPKVPRITDPSVPAGRRREIDAMMKKARASPNSNSYWDKKLLEVEEKDPNRWRHSGYKSMYLDGRGRGSRSRSPISTGATSSFSSNRHRSPRSPRHSSPQASRIRNSTTSSSHSSSSTGKRPPRTPPQPHVAFSRSPASSNRKSSLSALSDSSMSSCSDDNCSMCSPSRHRGRSRSRSFSVPRSRSGTKEAPSSKRISSPSKSKLPPKAKHTPAQNQSKITSQSIGNNHHIRMPKPIILPPASSGKRRVTPSRLTTNRIPVRNPAITNPNDQPTDPRRPPPTLQRPRPRAGEIIDVSGVKVPPKTVAPTPTATSVTSSTSSTTEPCLITNIKKERTGNGNATDLKTNKKKASTSTANANESSGSESDESPTISPAVQTTGMTLSERFGKIAQWTADRERRDMENMRITKTGSSTKVMIEGADEHMYATPPPRRYSLSPVPAGHYPKELLSSAPSRLGGWDDVRVRYQYYKDLGYLSDLTMDDYMKWEEWWYKYQDWLTNERDYERWLNSQRKRKRIPVSQRLN